MSKPETTGTHHIGLSTINLQKTTNFFIQVLGWSECGRIDSYPAIFVTDGSIMVTIWGIEEKGAIPFDRRKNIGLHHLAFKVPSIDNLYKLLDKIKNTEGIKIEFEPQPVGPGSKSLHFIVYEYTGIRIEFWADPQ